jgi:hypothetical protein
MGQYQQWLSAQEVDRRLRAEIETLETELFYLQDRTTILEQVVPATENVILRALAEHLQSPVNHERLSEEPAHSLVASGEQAQPVSGALPELAAPQVRAEEIVPYLPRAYTQREMSEDMLAFFDRRSQADPRLSAMLQRERQRARAGSESAPVVDEETRRLNENIERWFVRWHRDAPSEGVENEQ